MPSSAFRRIAAVVLGTLLVAGVACTSSNSNASSSGPCTPASTPTITLAAYSTVYDVYGKLISTWQKEWAAAHNGQQVIFSTSFGGSTTQAQNVANGYPADIVALSLAPDVQIIQKAGLITYDWTKGPDGGIVSTTPVVFDVRPGDPRHIANWNDLAQSGLAILTPDPSQSGGAKWNIVAAYGASMRGKVPGYAANSRADAQKLLTGIFRNVTVMDKSANDSLKNFQSGNGDVALTYENQVLASKAGGGSDQEVLPPSTVLVQNPTVVVTKNAQKHCVLPIANAFVKWLHSSEAQGIFQTVGYFRSVNLTQARKGIKALGQAPVQDLFTTNDIGGWTQLISTTVFGTSGAFTQALKSAKG